MDLIPNPIKFELSEPASELRGELNDLWHALEARRSKIEKETARLASIAAANFRPVDAEARGKNRLAEIALIQSELKILDRMKDEWPTVLVAERKGAAAKALLDADAMFAKIVAELVAIGFPGPDATVQGLARADIIARAHPAVVASRLLADELAELSRRPWNYGHGQSIDRPKLTARLDALVEASG